MPASGAASVVEASIVAATAKSGVRAVELVRQKERIVLVERMGGASFAGWRLEAG
jgi:hypothetical protein